MEQEDATSEGAESPLVSLRRDTKRDEAQTAPHRDKGQTHRETNWAV